MQGCSFLYRSLYKIISLKILSDMLNLKEIGFMLRTQH